MKLTGQMPIAAYFNGPPIGHSTKSLSGKAIKQDDTPTQATALRSAKRKGDAANPTTTKKKTKTESTEDTPGSRKGPSKGKGKLPPPSSAAEALDTDLSAPHPKADNLPSVQHRPQPTTIQPLPTPQTAGPSRGHIRSRPRSGALFPSSSPPDPTPRPREALLHTKVQMAGAYADLQRGQHLPTPSTNTRPRPRPNLGAHGGHLTLLGDVDKMGAVSPSSHAGPPTSPVRAGGSRAVLLMSPPIRGNIEPDSLHDNTEVHRMTSPVESDEPPAYPRQQATEVVSQTIIPTSQNDECSLPFMLPSSKPSKSLVPLSPTKQRTRNPTRSGTVVPSSQIFEHSFKLSPARQRIIRTPKKSPFRRPMGITLVTSPTVVPGTPTPMKMVYPASGRRKRTVPTIVDDDDARPVPGNPFLEALLGNGPVPTVEDSVVQSSQWQSDDEFRDDTHASHVVTTSPAKAAFIPTSQTQLEHDLVGATPSAFRRIAKDAQIVTLRQARSTSGTPSKRSTQGKYLSPHKRTPLRDLSKHRTPTTVRRRLFLAPASPALSPTQSTFALCTSPPRMLSSSSQPHQGSDDSEVARLMQHTPSPLRAFKEMFNDCETLSPVATRLAAAAEEDFTTDEDEALHQLRAQADWRRGRSISRSPRKERGRRVSGSASSPSPLHRVDGPLGSLPPDYSWSQSGASFDEDVPQVGTMEAVYGFLDLFDHTPEDESR